MTIVPFNNLLLVAVIAPHEKTQTTGIILPDKHIGRYIQYKVLAVGEKVTWIKKGDVVLGNATPDNEVVNNEGHKLINSADVFARVEDHE